MNRIAESRAPNKLISILRWILLLPAAMLTNGIVHVAASLFYYLLSVAAYYLTSSPMTSLDIILNGILVGLVSGAAGVYAGVWVAPSHRRLVSVVLVISFTALLLFGFFAYAPPVDTAVKSTLDRFGQIAGAIACAVLVIKTENFMQYPSVTKNRTGERIDGLASELINEALGQDNLFKKDERRVLSREQEREHLARAIEQLESITEVDELDE